MSTDPTVAAALHALRQHAPDLPLRSWRPITHGWDSLVLVLVLDETSGPATIARFARRPEIAAQFRMEAALLPALAPTLPVPVPRFIHVHLPASGLAFVAYPLLPGDPLSSLAAAPAAPAAPRLAAQIGAFLDALHRFPPALASALSGLPAATPADWRREYTDFYAWVRAAVSPLLEPHERAAVAALWERFLVDDTSFAFTPALIHRDLAAEHILYDPAAAALTGVLDWGDAAVGDPALDFTGLLADLGAPFAETALAAYSRPIDPAFRRRMAFYRNVIPFHQLRFGLTAGDRRHVTDGLIRLRSQFSGENS